MLGGYSVLNRRFAGVDNATIVRPASAYRCCRMAAHALFEPATAIATAQWWVLATMGIGPTGIAFTLWDRGANGDIALIGSSVTSRRCCRRCRLILTAGRAEPRWIQALAVALLLLLARGPACTPRARQRPPPQFHEGLTHVVA